MLKMLLLYRRFFRDTLLTMAGMDIPADMTGKCLIDL